MRTLKAAPSAAILIESMRDIGYSLDTALADIVDNSITAGATRVDIHTTSGSATSIVIIDDGCGMDADELLTAMRPGSRSPLADRAETDLGRFGLGLKTASFSQCRRLTVAARKDGVTSALRWDLDRVTDEDAWLVEVIEDHDSIAGIVHLGERGTLVAWEQLDRVAEGGDDDGHHFNRKLLEASKHLELVFHRFLEGEPGLPRLTITLNHRPLVAFDPFFTRHPATISAPVETIQFKGIQIKVRAYTLPHHNRVKPQEWDHHGGTAGYLKNQGFYLYRARRLIVHGTWFGLARQREATKLARVRIDVPNELDAWWKVDVKKASAHPPGPVRERLRVLMETLGAPSKRVYSKRGKRLLDQNKLPVWHRKQAHGQISYVLNSEHPVLSGFTLALPDNLRADFRRVLEVAAASLPLDALFSDLGAEDGSVTTEWIPDDTLSEALAASVRALTCAGFDGSLIAEMLQLAEPFRSNWKRTSGLLHELLKGAGS